MRDQISKWNDALIESWTFHGTVMEGRKTKLAQPAEMNNKQLRLLVKIEKLLFEKKDDSFEKVLKQAKEQTWP